MSRAPDTLTPAYNWRHDAECSRGYPYEWWFPVGSSDTAKADTARAKTVCARCPVMDTCLDWAMEHPAIDGVWGGATEEERKSVRRGRGQQNRAGRDLEPCGTPAAYRRHFRRHETVDFACREANRLAQMEKAEATS